MNIVDPPPLVFCFLGSLSWEGYEVNFSFSEDWRGYVTFLNDTSCRTFLMNTLCLHLGFWNTKRQHFRESVKRNVRIRSVTAAANMLHGNKFIPFQILGSVIRKNLLWDFIHFITSLLIFISHLKSLLTLRHWKNASLPCNFQTIVKKIDFEKFIFWKKYNYLTFI